MSAMLTVIAAMGFVLQAAAPALAAPGDLDTTFGTGGKVTTPIGSGHEQGRGVAIQPDGKIVLAGYSVGSTFDFALARYTTTGALDSTFGTGGKVTTPIGAGEDVAQAVAIQADGKIVAAGYSNIGSTLDFAVVRYTTTGALDSTFGTGGKVTTPIGSSIDVASAVVIQADGKIVAAGYSRSASTNDDFALVRYTTTGALDSTFGTGGKVTTQVAATNNQDAADGVAIQSDGKIVAAGWAIGSSIDFALARYTITGALDSTFGTGGKVITPVGSSFDYGRAVAIQGDGKIVVAGESWSSASDFALVRYTSAGALDSTFGTAGKVITPVSSAPSFAHDFARAVAIQSNGKIVAVGGVWNGSNYDFALARYTTAGALDSTFGTGGKVITPIGSGEDIANGVAVQPDGKIVAAGYGTSTSTGNDFALARYLGDAADIAITLTDSPDPAIQGGNITYTLTVANTGTLQATGVVAFVQLPTPHVSFVSNTPGSPTCNGTAGSSTIECGLGSVNPGSSATVTVVARAEQPGPATALASAWANQQEYNYANNETSTSTTINGLNADISVSLTDAPDPARVGEKLIYTLQVSNSGPSKAYGVTLSFPLPSTTTFVSLSKSQGTCSSPAQGANGTVSCNLRSIAAGGAAKLTVRVRPTQAGTLSATATIAQQNPDPTPGDHTATATTAVA
jgi:uncharacterized delta-60 repeat protein/uncharacterized repeat protein (TIGR01451 family)